MPKVSAGMVVADLKALTPNWKRMPAIMPAAMPGGIRRMILSKEPETPIRKMMTAAVM